MAVILRRRSSQPVLIFLLFSGLVFAGSIGVVFLVPQEKARIVLIDLHFALAHLLVTATLFWAARRSRSSRRLFLAWLALAFAQLSYNLGDAVWTVLELFLHRPTFPSLADGFYLLFYPLFLIGVGLLPARPLSGLERVKTALDMGIVLLAAALVLWNFLLGPIALAGVQETWLVQALSLAYPTGDLLLLWALLMLLHRQPPGQSQAPVRLLAAGVAVMIVTDIVFGFQSLLGTYTSGSPTDLGWILSILLIGAAGVWQAAGARSGTSARSIPFLHLELNIRLDFLWTCLPYVWLVGAYLLLILAYDHPLPMSFPGLFWGVSAIMALVLARQAATLHENTRLSDELRGALGRMRQQAAELAAANRELQAEIEERKRAEVQILYDALHDDLTGLPNRALFMDRLRHALKLARRHPVYAFSILFLDLDQFKVVNDSLGHATGDQLLLAIAQRIRDGLRASDTLARLGGDEFVILAEDIQGGGEAAQFAGRLQDVLSKPLTLDGRTVFATASIGVVLDGNGYERAEDILRDAEIAMYQAKAQGKARFEIFTPSYRDLAMTRLEIENDLRGALERQEFELHYQPILHLGGNRLSGFEALIRWQHPRRGLVSPAEFIPVAEESGLILPIGRWVLLTACRQLQQWVPRSSRLKINVNISGSQLTQPGFVDQVDQILQETGLDPHRLRLEITESVWLNGSESLHAVFAQLNAMGVRLELDDFGTGYSSLSYLQNFPIQSIKIDRSFISRLEAGGSHPEIVRTIIVLAHDLGMQAVGEGIETPQQLDRLKEFGCDLGQGYLLGRPGPKADAEHLIGRQMTLRLRRSGRQGPVFGPSTAPGD